MKRNVRKLLRLSGLGLIALLCSQAQAAGFKLESESTSVMADSGDAAVVEDVSTNWYNSAGLVYLPQQAVFSGMYLYSSTNFKGSSFAPGATPPSIPGLVLPRNSFSGNGSASSYGNIILPAIHYGVPFGCDNRYAFGISIVPAWGLLEDYGEHSIVRYDLTRIYTKSLDIAPSFAVKLTDQLSVGFGPDFHYFLLNDKNHVRTQLPVILGTPQGDSISRVSADSWGYGGHIGLLYRINDRARVGINYRSKIINNLQGYSDFAFNGFSSFETGNFKLDFVLPPTTSLSAYYDVTPCWALMGTLVYDQWSVVRNLHGRNYIVPVTATTSRLTDVVIGQDYNNTFDLGIGTHYKLNDQVLLRGSVKYLQTPTNNQFRDISFPDGEKLGINLGGRYQINPKVAMDLIYVHVFVKTRKINVTSFTNVHTQGHVSSGLDFFGAQAVFNI